MKPFLNQHRLAAFFALAFALSWYPWIFALIRGQTSGPNPLGPLLAALIMTAITSGRSGLREFLKRIIRYRVGLKWYAIVFGIPVLVCLVSIGLTFCVQPHLQASALSIEKIRELPERFIFILLFIGLGEESGWRGFALPELQTKYSAFRASLVLAPIWAVWHLPLIGNEFPWPVVAPFLISVFGATFLLTWIFNRTNDSVLLPMLCHATVNSVGASLFFPLFSGAPLILLWWLYSLLWLCTGLAVLYCDGRSPRATARHCIAMDTPTPGHSFRQ